MPRESRENIGRLPTVDLASSPQPLKVVARPVDQTVLPDTQNDPLAQLVGGLAKFNPQLQDYVQERAVTEKIKEEEAKGKAKEAGKETALGNPEAITDPLKAIQTPESMPSSVLPAYRPQFEEGYLEVINMKMADRIADDIRGEWSKVRREEGTDVEAFLAREVSKSIQGVTDPKARAAVGKRLMEIAKDLRTDALRISIASMERTARESVNALFGRISPEQSTAGMMTTYYNEIVPVARKTGLFSMAELGGMLIDRMSALSSAMGGAPELFAALKDEKDPATGKSLYDMNPALAEKIDAHRAAADRMVEHKLEQASQPILFEKRLKWKERTDAGNPPTREEIKSEIGPRGLFQTDDQAMAYYLDVQRSMDRVRSKQYRLELASQGLLGAVSSREEQVETMDDLTAPYVSRMLSVGNQTGGERQFNQDVAQIIHLHDIAGTVVPNTQLKHAFEAIRQSFPKPGEKPSQMFKNLVNVYSQFPANLQTAYVSDESTRLLLSRYHFWRSQGPGTQVDEETAYARAFASVSPEAQEVAKRRVATAEGREAIRQTVHNVFSVVGWRKFLGFQTLGTYPDNEDSVVASVQHATRLFVESMPDVSEGDARDFAKRYFVDNFVLDRTSNKYVGIPGGAATSRAEDAISDFTEKMIKKYGKDARPMLVHMGRGRYQVRGVGVAGGILDYTSLQEMLDDQYALKTLDSKTNEPQRLRVLEEALMRGTATAEQLKKEEPLIARAKTLGLWDGENGRRLDEARAKVFRDALPPVIGPVPKASMDGVDVSRLPPNSDKVEIAKLFWERGTFGKALTVLGEGVVYQAYPDPAKGSNIGVAYNMDANKGTIRADFRRAKIAEEQIDEVIAGKRAITKEQAMRLFDISYARAEDSARAFVTKRHGASSWEQLPHIKRAVLVDIAYQVGSIDQFESGVAKFVAELQGAAGPDVTKAKGLLEAGNIDLASRRSVKNADGSISTVRSMSVGIDGKEVLIPTVSDDGRLLSEDQAIEQYKKTGKHLGKFDTPEHATEFAKALHKAQEEFYRQGPTNIVVHFRDRKTGEMRPDTGRNNLRLNMLNGEAQFQALIDRLAGKPRDAMQSRALLAPQSAPAVTQ